jgi:raffinose/stachyose/melibiose transport system permease protein
MKITERVARTVVYVILLLTSLIILYPILTIFLSSLKTMPDFMGNPLGMPKSFTMQNYVTAWNKMKFGVYTVNSLLITLFTIALVTVSGAMAGYKLSRNIKGSRSIYLYFLAGMSIPTQSFIITLFSFLKSIHMISSYSGMIFTYSAMQLPLAIMLFTGFFKGVPKDILEAPQIDGCSEMRLFVQILIPLCKPIIATEVIMVGMSVWNDFFVQMIINMDQSKYTLPMGLVKFRGETSVNWTPLFAGIMMVAIPIVVLFLALQSQFIKGLTNGAVKG